jgi:hypothetical protein
MKKIFQQPAAHVELDEHELAMITGGSCSHKHKHLPPPPPQKHKHSAPHFTLPVRPQGGQPGGFGGR